MVQFLTQNFSLQAPSTNQKSRPLSLRNRALSSLKGTTLFTSNIPKSGTEGLNNSCCSVSFRKAVTRNGIMSRMLAKSWVFQAQKRVSVLAEPTELVVGSVRCFCVSQGVQPHVWLPLSTPESLYFCQVECRKDSVYRS